jgi:hypothetical protein
MGCRPVGILSVGLKRLVGDGGKVRSADHRLYRFEEAETAGKIDATLLLDHLLVVQGFARCLAQ